MTKDIREKAEALIELLEREAYYDQGCKVNLREMRQYKALKASLRPSREQIADYLEGSKDREDGEVYTEMLNYAIEELRRKP